MLMLWLLALNCSLYSTSLASAVFLPFCISFCLLLFACYCLISQKKMRVPWLNLYIVECRVTTFSEESWELNLQMVAEEKIMTIAVRSELYLHLFFYSIINSNTSSNRDKDSRECFSCGKTGHRASDCPNGGREGKNRQSYAFY